MTYLVTAEGLNTTVIETFAPLENAHKRAEKVATDLNTTATISEVVGFYDRKTEWKPLHTPPATER